MNSAKNYTLAALALATVGGAFLAWQQYGELVELRASALNLNERSDLQARIADLERQNREMQERLAARTRRGPGDLAAGGAAEGGPGERGPRGGERGRFGDAGPMGAAMRELMAKPEVQAMMSLQQKAMVDSRYAALFKNLNLTPEQADKLKTLLADRVNTPRDVAEAARSQGIDPRENRETFAKLLTDAQTSLDASIKSVIGEQGYAQLQSYEQTLPQRNVVEQLQRQLNHTDTPLTSAQSEQLVQILAANAPAKTATTTAGSTPTATTLAISGPQGDFAFSVPGPGPGIDGGRMVLGMGGPGGGAATVTPAAVTQAQTVLSASQTAALQQIQQQQATQQQLQQMIRDTLGTPSGTGTGTTESGGTGTAPARKQRPGG